MSGATSVLIRYIELVGAHDLAPLDELFADDLIATTGGGNFDKAEWIAALARLLPVVVRNEIREVFEGAPSTNSGADDAVESSSEAEGRSGAKACVVYDFVTDTPAGAVPCVEWVTVVDDRITTVELVFEKAHWADVVAALQERAQLA
jgi:hypothetical protein